MIDLLLSIVIVKDIYTFIFHCSIFQQIIYFILTIFKMNYTSILKLSNIYYGIHVCWKYF